MNQQQPRKSGNSPEPIKFGDVFPVEGELAGRAVTTEDATAMQMAEEVILGKTQKGGAAEKMQAAAVKNEVAGVGGDGGGRDLAGEGINITQTEMAGRKIVTESVAGQVLTENIQRVPMGSLSFTNQQGGGGITIGEALEATALTVGQQPVKRSDAAAIQAAEVRATGRMNIVPGGVAAAAQSAATLNARTTRDEEKIKLADVLKDARLKLPADRPATRRDAEGVAGAEMRNDPLLTTHPTGVAASVAAAARLNQNLNKNKK